MKFEDVDQLVGEIVKSFIRGDACGAIILFDADLELAIMQFEPKSKKHKHELLSRGRRLAKIRKAVVAVVASEAWSVCTTEHDRSKLPDDLGDHPGKVEILMINAELLNMSKTYMYDIERDENDKISDLILREDTDDGFKIRENNINILNHRKLH